MKKIVQLSINLFLIIASFALIASEKFYFDNVIDSDLNQEIQLLNIEIAEFNFPFTNKKKLPSLYNDRGIYYFALKDYEAALNDFNIVLTNNCNSSDENFGLALWGRALCHACLGNFVEVQEDLQILRNVFIDDLACIEKEKRSFSNSSIPLLKPFYHNQDQCCPACKKPLNFQNPNEIISASECVARVRGCTSKLKDFTVPLIKDPRIAWLFAMFIGELGNAAEYCCKDGSIWVSCVTPLLERLEKWRFCGIPADPYFDN